MRPLALSATTFRVDDADQGWILSPVGPMAYLPHEVLALANPPSPAPLFRATLVALAPDYARGGVPWTPAATRRPWALYQAEFMLDHWQPSRIARPEEPLS